MEIIHIQVCKVQPEDDVKPMPDDKPRRLHVLQFDIEMAKCVHCGICVENCPNGAIHWEPHHEEVVLHRGDLMRHWAEFSAAEVKRLSERDAAIKKAKAEAAEKAKAAKEAEAAKAGNDTEKAVKTDTPKPEIPHPETPQPPKADSEKKNVEEEA